MNKKQVNTNTHHIKHIWVIQGEPASCTERKGRQEWRWRRGGVRGKRQETPATAQPAVGRQGGERPQQRRGEPSV